MNCTDFDILYGEIVTHVSTATQIFWISSLCFISILSFFLIVAGEKILRPVAAIIAAGAGIVIGYGLCTEMGELKCHVRLIISGIFALVLAILAACLLKAGIFILGGAAFGAVGHYIFDVIPEDVLPVVFATENRSGLYWIVVGGSALLGALLAICLKKEFLRIATSMIGGSGAALSTYIMTEKIKKPPVHLHPGILLGIAIVCLVIGVSTQNYFARKKKHKNKKFTKKEINEMINYANTKHNKRINKNIIEELVDNSNERSNENNKNKYSATGWNPHFSSIA
jgi:hypothetical protein